MFIQTLLFQEPGRQGLNKLKGISKNLSNADIWIFRGGLKKATDTVRYKKKAFRLFNEQLLQGFFLVLVSDQ